MTKVDETFLAAFKERVAAQEISRFWQLELEEVGPGRAKVSMVCRPEMANILGMVHGSAIFALIDEAFQAAVNGHGTVAVALNMNLTFHAAAKMGERLTAVNPGTPRRPPHRHLFHRGDRPPGDAHRLLPGPGLPQGHAVGVCPGVIANSQSTGEHRRLPPVQAVKPAAIKNCSLISSCGQKDTDET